MRNYKIIILGALSMLLMFACKNETTEKLKEAKDNIGNVTNVISNVKEAQEVSVKLRELTPMENAELKAWLPEQVEDLNRTGFKVGKAGYMNVASIEGTFKSEDGREFKVEVIDGAGKMGSSLMTGMSMASNMDIEEEDERKHLKTVTKNGIKAKQTYYKKRDDTDLQFVYGERFIVMIKARDMNPKTTWDLVNNLSLDNLIK